MSDDTTPDRVLSFRQVLPRWRRPVDAAKEMGGVSVTRRSPVTSRSNWLEKLRASHERTSDPSTAREILETAFILNAQLPAAEQRKLESHSLRTTSLLDEMTVSDPIRRASETPQQAIQALRRKLEFSPHQALAWTEIARQYLATGSDKRADHAMSCALSLAPNNRYVIRSAVRFHSRSKEGLDRALHLLRSTPRTVRDPWLLSAEIATADKAERTSPYINLARRILDQKGHPPRHYSELAAAVGTLEHDSGRHKRAKLLFAQALEDPTNNSLAQAVFVSREDSKIMVHEQVELRQSAFEARSRAAYAKGDFAEAMDRAFAWLSDEPFDVMPALMGSYLSFEPDLAPKAENLASLGLMSSPHHPILLNNRAVARAYLGDLAGALSDMKLSTKMRKEDSPFNLATLGLIAYRAGFADFGRKAYMSAIAWFVTKRDSVSTYRACLYWFREAIRAGEEVSANDLANLRARIAKLPIEQQESDLLALISVAESELETAPLNPLWDETEESLPMEFESIRASISIPDHVSARTSALLRLTVQEITNQT